MFEKIKARISMAAARLVYAVVMLFAPTAVKVQVRRFWVNQQGKVGVMSIIGLTIAVIVAAYTLPTAIIALTNTTAYSVAGATVPTAVVTLMTTVAGIVVAAVFILLLLRHR